MTFSMFVSYSFYYIFHLLRPLFQFSLPANKKKTSNLPLKRKKKKEHFLKNFPAHQPRNLKKGNLISTTKRFKKQNKPIIICIHVCVLYYTLHTHTTLGIAGLLICLYHSLILISLIIQAHYSLFIR